MRRFKQTIGLLLTMLVVTVAIVACNDQTNQAKAIVVGSKNFTESIILGELIAQQIEASTDLEVKRRLNLGGTFICHQAITTGELDIYPEYTGTAFVAILKNEPSSNADAVASQLQKQYQEDFQLTWLPSFGFANNQAIVIRGEDARQFAIATISDVTAYTPEWQAGFDFEFIERKDGLDGLLSTYEMVFAGTPKTMDYSLTYRALADGQVDLISVGTTDALIESLDLVVLKDDRNYFPTYTAAPVVRLDTLAEHPELEPALSSLAGRLDAVEMRRLNYLVDVEEQDVKQVVSDFLATL
ncbi:ABC-type glycine betaine transport, periplasmic subunit [Thalassoporum mexicanum PCC 7367]|uniref:glycine betaine ABC transporter substrate-binding protein n=1 Tax=Thalassoporum mexicanum TaxID=3457544 RepID=UPI00029FD317|nr:glycine betaine ABC transporter substrate-binding protein [Pseudanabaena sp. PCC 7367]AFY71712.1 ABC-type glycine betaine transport, periplasmic subunit [Pseudanabaena sp. PCC 7367]